MRPAARIQAAIDLVVLIESEAADSGNSTDEAIRRFFRQRRYAGSGDRRAVTTLALEVIRHRGAGSWRLGDAASPRTRVALELKDNPGSWGALHTLYSGDDPHGPDSLNSEEKAALDAAAVRNPDDAPADACYGFPAFLTERLAARFGDRLDAEMAALAQRAGLDIRVNTLKSNINTVIQAIEKEGLEVQGAPWSSTALRLPAGARLDAMTAYTSGAFDVQDEGSQVAAMLSGAQPGEQVLDLCAGAGGKTLALAAMMQNKGQIYATDNDPRRLKPIHDRLQKAGVRNVQAFALDAEGRERLAQMKGSMDLVVIDSPCSGSGTWRRDPALPWRLTEERLQALNEVQAGLLREGAEMLRPGGRLLYITCSIIPDENEKVIETFLSESSGWQLVPYSEQWQHVGEGDPAPTLSHHEGMLQMSPASHGTDGFFVAVIKVGD